MALGSRPEPGASADVASKRVDDTVPASDSAVDRAAEPPRIRPGPSTPPPIDPMFRPSSRGERYVLGDELGKGGMGRVVEATDTRLGRQVAIKEALPKNPDLQRRFEREVRITARLEHPSIVPLYDVGTSADGNPFYVMRKVTGRPLEKLILESRTLDARLALLPNVLAAIEAIGHAHRRGVVHRDMKPANVLVGELGETVVIDWGLAKVLGEDDDPDSIDRRIDRSLAPSAAVETQVGSVFGTPGFMAPEQARGEPLDPRTDVYALGATMYQLLSGRPPHHGTSATEVIDKALTVPPRPLDALVDGVPPELAAIVDKALAYDRDVRYADAAALAEDLRRFLTGQLVAAHRYTSRQRVVRFVRRHRAAFVVGGLAAVVLTALAIVGVFNIVRERDRAQRAETAAISGKAAAEQARDREIDRGHELLITTARYQAEVNPTAAIASLKQLPPTSKRWPEARAVAIDASFRGVAWGIASSRMTTTLEIDPDGGRLLSGGEAGRLRIHDLATREELYADDVGDRVVGCWLASDRIAYAVGHALHVVVPSTRAARTIPLLAPSQTLIASPRGDRIVSIENGGKASLIEIDAGIVVPLHPDLEIENAAFDPQGEWMILAGEQRSRVVDMKGATLLDVARTGRIAVSATGKRFALVDAATATEYEVAGGRIVVRQEMTQPKSHLMFYGVYGNGENLTIFARSKLLRFEDGVVVNEWPTSRTLMMGTVAWDGNLVFSADDASLVTLARTGRMVRIPGPSNLQLVRITGARNSRFVAASSNGLILVWRIDLATPRVLRIPQSPGFTFAGEDTLIVDSLAGPWMLVDVRTGATERFDIGHPTFMWHIARSDPKSGRILLRLDAPDHGRLFLVDRPLERSRVVLDGGANDAELLVDGRIVWGNDAGQVQVALPPGAPRVLARGTAPILAVLEIDGDTIFTIDEAGRTQWITLSTGAIVRSKVDGTPTGAASIDGDGRPVLAIGKVVVRHEPTATTRLAEFDESIMFLVRTAAGPVLAVTRGGDAFLLDQPGTPRRVLSRGKGGPGIDPDGVVVSTVDAMNRIAVVDLASSTRWHIPLEWFSTYWSVSSGGRHVAHRVDDEQVAIWTNHAPSADPGAMLRWMDELTNAKAVGSEVAWPWQVDGAK